MLDAWPNTFRQSRFLSAVDFVQADRLRRKVAQEMARVFSGVDLLLVPSLPGRPFEHNLVLNTTHVDARKLQWDNTVDIRWDPPLFR